MKLPNKGKKKKKAFCIGKIVASQSNHTKRKKKRKENKIKKGQ